MNGELSSTADTAQAAVTAVAAYVGIQAKIAELEAEAEIQRAAIKELLQGEPGKVWAFPGLATVAMVRGRVSERLDRAALAKAGVSVQVLDAATVRTEGAPSLRISAERPEDTRRTLGMGK